MRRGYYILWVKTCNLYRGLKSIMIAVSTVTDDLGKCVFWLDLKFLFMKMWDGIKDVQHKVRTVDGKAIGLAGTARRSGSR